MSGPTPTNEAGDSKCLAYFGTGHGAAICRRPEGHKSITEDGIGHSVTPFPIAARLAETSAQIRDMLHQAWLAGRRSKESDTSPYA